ncbi:MAG: sensor histidine kinase, partial [Alicyclobacillus sp.]|nr:sensor histidine kinase [Alicyclobacillus sp.]
IHEESARMGRLVGDLLTLSRLESQADVLHPVSVRLRDVAEQAVQTVQAQAEKLQLSVGISAGDDVFVTADAEKLHQVFLNLLVNAMHYTPAGGRIDVSWEMDAGKATVHVRDTGIGIPEAHQQRIFERFYRVDRDRSRATGGTGLGLAIVKHIVTAHGGEVGVRSQPGAGSDFWFTLPRRATE